MTIRNKDANGSNGIPSSNNGGQFAQAVADIPTNVNLDALREEMDGATAKYCRGIEHYVATQIAKQFPDVAYLEFDHLQEGAEIIPWLTDALDANEQPVDDQTVDDIRNDFLSGITDREFGEWASGNTINLIPARHPAYVHGGTEAAQEAMAADEAETAALETVEGGCARVGWNSLADMIERLHDREQVDITDSARLTDEQLETLAERHFAGLVDRFCDSLGEGEQVDADECVTAEEWERFKERGPAELGASSTTMEAIETALDREEIRAGALDSIDVTMMDNMEDHTERALARLAVDVRIMIEE